MKGKSSRTGKGTYTRGGAGDTRRTATSLPYAITFAMLIIVIIALSFASLSCKSAKTGEESGNGLEENTRATSPLTGLPLADRGSAARRAVAVKVENAQQARPQSGLDRAGVVYEELVEGGITRFIALYLDVQATEIGPVRSARPMDVDILAHVDPLLVVSGGSPGVMGFLRTSDLSFIEEDSGPYFWRARDRRAPHNLYTSTMLLQEALKDRGMEEYRWGEDLFRFGEPREGESAESIEVKYPGSCGASYRYDANTGTYPRSVAGKPHTDKVSGAQLAPTTVIVQYVDLKDSGVRDMAGELSPDAVVVGSGEALIFTSGKVYRARWEKPDPSRRTLFLDEKGEEITLKPGQVWVHLVPRSIRVAYQ